MHSGRFVFSQAMDHLPMKTFHRCVQRYQGNRHIQSFTCLDQFLCMAFAQLTSEGVDQFLRFTVSLRPAARRRASVYHETGDGTATTPEDFAYRIGQLWFEPGEASKDVPIPIVDDDHQDHNELMLLGLAYEEGAALVRDNGTDEARGTIRNTESAGPALAATLASVPESHGGNPITFALDYGEEVDISYRTPRDSAFSVTHGAVEGARRKIQGSNQRWIITIAPSGTDDVTVTLPASTAGAADDAFCTADNRPIATALSATVPNAVTTATQTPPPVASRWRAAGR